MRRERWWLHILLLVLTFVTTTMIGAEWAVNANPALRSADPRNFASYLPALVAGLAYSLPLIAILLAHEMGHYVMCLRYGVDASPPYFLPFPPIFTLIGTMGAVIRIRQPLRTKKEVFDIGVAGPIAGFLVALPVLAYGVVHTQVKPRQEVLSGSIVFQYPLLVTWFQKAFRGSTFTSHEVLEHPAFMAAWFGLLLTAFNLIPLAQLDGGHALYAVAGRRHRPLAWGILAVLAALGYWFPGWWVIGAVVIIVMRVHHPPVPDEDVPLDRGRLLVFAATVLIFVLSFTPIPIALEDSSSGPFRGSPPGEGRGTVVHQLDLHRRAEPAGRGGHAVGPKGLDVSGEQRLRPLGSGSALETRTPSA